MSIVKYNKETCDPCNTEVPNQHSNAAIPTYVRPSITSCDKLCGENVAGSAIEAPTKPEGTPLKTKAYYNQVLDAGDTQHNVDTALNPVFQRLAKIIDMTLYLSDTMENTVNDQGATVLSGSGIAYGQFVPHIGDVFIYNMQGADYLFRVTGVDALTSAPTTNYTVTFKSSTVVAPGDAFLIDLESKTTDVDTYRYVGGRLTVGKDPILPNTVAAQGVTLLAIVERLTCAWHNTYYHRDSATYAVVSEGKSYYDPQVVKFMDRITGQTTSFANAYNNIWHRQVSMSQQTSLTIYDQLLNRSCSLGTVTPIIPKLYPRASLSGVYSFNYLKFTPIDFLSATDSFIRDTTTSAAMKTIPNTTVFGSDTVADKYVVGDLTTPVTELDKLVSKLMTSTTLSVAEIQSVDAELMTQTEVDRYWTIPLLIAGVKLLLNQTG